MSCKRPRLGKIEIGEMRGSLVFLQDYENFLTAVIDGKIDVPRSVMAGKKAGRTHEPTVSRKKITELKAIREKLCLTGAIVARHVYLGASTVYSKELFYSPTSQEEYDRFMKYYKQVKLQRIFGANYKEKKHDAN